MTTEVKRQAIDNFCKAYGDCNGCPKKGNAFCMCYSHHTAEPKVIDEWFEYLFGEVSQDNVNHPSHYESGLSLYQISALEQRDKEPDIIELKLICKALNVSPKIFINF